MLKFIIQMIKFIINHIKFLFQSVKTFFVDRCIGRRCSIIYFFSEFFDSFLIPDYIIHKKFEDNITEEYIKYLDKHKSDYDYHCFISEHTRQEEEDCYYNYYRVRTLTIDIKEILNYLKDISFHKDLEEIASIFHNIPQEKLQSFALYSHLNNAFPEKNIPTKKKKI